jgi:hypothetical protein
MAVAAAATITERGAAADGGVLASAAVMPAASSLTKPQQQQLKQHCYSYYRRLWVLLALQAVGLFWALLGTADFSFLPEEPRHASAAAASTSKIEIDSRIITSRGRWRIRPFSWLSTSKTGAILALSQDFEVQRKQTKITASSSSSPSIKRNVTTYSTTFLGVTPRVFMPWNTKKNGNNKNRSLADLCFAAEPKIMTMAVQRSPAKQGGIFLNKLMKVGGSTAAGINIRIAMRIYKDSNNNNNNNNAAAANNNNTNTSNALHSSGTNAIDTSNNTMKNKTFPPLCRGRWDHSQALKMQYGQRDLDHSFLWTVVREPTKRGVFLYCICIIQNPSF